MRLGMKASREIFEAHYRRCQQAGKKEKGKNLDEAAGTTGLNRDHLAHVSASCGKKQAAKGEAQSARKKREPGKCGGRPPRYQGRGFAALPARIWENYGRPCGKLPASLIRGIIDFLVASGEPDYGISDEQKALLVKISGAWTGRLFSPARKALWRYGGIRTTRAAGASLRSQAPVQIGFDRKTVKPGDFAFDTAAHCGSPASERFCKTLTGTSPYSCFRLGGGARPAERSEQAGGGGR